MERHQKRQEEEMASKERVLKLTIMQHRNQNISEEEFHAHWTKKHGPIAAKWFERNGILGYTQYHTPGNLKAQAADIAKEVGWTMSPYDGHVEILLRDVEDLKKAVQDPEYPERIGPDEERFLDQSRSMVTVGWEEVYVRDGKVVELEPEVFANEVMEIDK